MKIISDGACTYGASCAGHDGHDSSVLNKRPNTAPAKGSPSSLLSRAVGCVLAAALGSGATAVDQAQGQDGVQGGVLQEVVVTATRREESLNRVPVSVAAVTQQSFDEQGFKNVEDLQKAVPSLNVIGGANTGVRNDSTNSSTGNFAIRGILSRGGSPTTGVYLDDVALHKRNGVSSASVNGTPTPMLYDLQRIEVLRGPQGTLYGGSSEGGAIRFITRQPSLTETSANVQAETSWIDEGEASYEINGAFGGPLIDEVLGFRISGYGRHNGGWIDMRDPYTAGIPVRFEDANSSDATAFRGGLVYKPTDPLQLALSLYHHRFEAEGGTTASSYWETLTGSPTFTTPARCYNGTQTPVACTTPGAFVRPVDTYGPYELGPYDSLDYFLMSSVSTLDVASLTIDYDFGAVALKSVSSYLEDEGDGDGRSDHVAIVTQSGFPLYHRFPENAPTWPAHNKRESFTQEMRLSYSGGSLDVIGGLYYATSDIDVKNAWAIGANGTKAEADLVAQLMFGIADANNLFALPLLPDNTAHNRTQSITDKESAAYLDVTWHLTDRLSLLAGLRYSILDLDFQTVHWGPTAFRLVPTEANGGITNGTVEEKPVTPRVGVQFQWTPDAMLYATAAEGFRGGGVNPTFNTSSGCFTLASSFGLTTADLPKTYDSDSVWSYEVGAKLRLADRVQVNTSVYHIDWKDVQVNTAIGGCPPFDLNGGTARSRGFDLQLDAVVTTGLTASLGLGYVDAEYTEDVTGPTPTLPGNFAAVIIREAGDPLPVPAWQGNASLKYEFSLAGAVEAYIRGDYLYTGGYDVGSRPGLASYSPDNREREAIDLVNMRFGISRGTWDVSLFVNNLFESRDVLSSAGGRSSCPISQGAACTTPGFFNPLRSVTYSQPRTIGVQLGYQF